MGKSYIIWIVSVKYYTYKYVLEYFMGFCGDGIVLKMAQKCVYFDRVQKKCAHMFIIHINGISFIAIHN